MADAANRLGKYSIEFTKIRRAEHRANGLELWSLGILADSINSADRLLTGAEKRAPLPVFLAVQRAGIGCIGLCFKPPVNTGGCRFPIE